MKSEKMGKRRGSAQQGKDTQPQGGPCALRPAPAGRGLQQGGREEGRGRKELGEGQKEGSASIANETLSTSFRLRTKNDFQQGDLEFGLSKALV